MKLPLARTASSLDPADGHGRYDGATAADVSTRGLLPEVGLLAEVCLLLVGIKISLSTWSVTLLGACGTPAATVPRIGCSHFDYTRTRWLGDGGPGRVADHLVMARVMEQIERAGLRELRHDDGAQEAAQEDRREEVWLAVADRPVPLAVAHDRLDEVERIHGPLGR